MSLVGWHFFRSKTVRNPRNFGCWSLCSHSLGGQDVLRVLGSEQRVGAKTQHFQSSQTLTQEHGSKSCPYGEFSGYMSATRVVQSHSVLLAELFFLNVRTSMFTTHVRMHNCLFSRNIDSFVVRACPSYCDPPSHLSFAIPQGCTGDSVRLRLVRSSHLIICTHMTTCLCSCPQGKCDSSRPRFNVSTFFHGGRRPKNELLDPEFSNATTNQELVFSTRPRTTPHHEDERKRSRRLSRAEYVATMIVDDGMTFYCLQFIMSLVCCSYIPWMWSRLKRLSSGGLCWQRGVGNISPKAEVRGFRNV